nr:hypothetical protein [uncultured Methanobacterium sp.]
MSKYGAQIREQFPDRSPLHEDNNPMRELIEKGIGPEFDQIEIDLFTASNSRFLLSANETTLELFREWFGVPKRDISLDEYRAFIIAVKTANITITGIKKVIGNILNIESSKIIVIDGSGRACKAGITVAADHHTGTPCVFAGHYSETPGIVTVRIPEGQDITLVESVINQLVLASVTVYLEEYV